MKMIYFSPDRLEVEQLARQLSEAGIPCAVRDRVPVEDTVFDLPEAELWLEDGGDSHRAYMFCVAQGAGFAKKVGKVPTLDDLFAEVLAA